MDFLYCGGKVFWTKWFAKQDKKESHNKNEKAAASSAEEIATKAKKSRC